MGPNEGAIASPVNPNFAPNLGVAPQSSPDSFTPPIPGAMGTPIEASTQSNSQLPGHPVEGVPILPGAGIPGMVPEAQAPIGTPAYINQTPAYTEAPPPIAANTQPIPTNQPSAETFASMSVPPQPDLSGLPSSNPLTGPQFPSNPSEALQSPIGAASAAPPVESAPPQPAPPQTENQNTTGETAVSPETQRLIVQSLAKAQFSWDQARKSTDPEHLEDAREATKNALENDLTAIMGREWKVPTPEEAWK